MADGFDVSELTDFSKKILARVSDELPKESRKFIKKQANLLNKKNKLAFNSTGIGEGGKDTLKGFKAGKVYKYKGALSVRAFNSSIVTSKDGKKYSFGAMMNNGFMHINRDGSESFVPGHHFMEKSLVSFQNQYVSNCEQFISEMIPKML